MSLRLCVMLMLVCGACALSSQRDRSGGMSGSGADGGVGGSGGTGGTGGNGGVGGSGGTGGSGGVGGVGGSGGAGGDSGTGGVMAIDECDTDDDCRLAGGCCDCVSVPKDQPGPGECPAICDEPRCAELGVEAVRCVLGRCVFDASCDQDVLICFRAPPQCAEGEQPIIRNGCFGECVDARECNGVTHCDVCHANGQACAGTVATGSIQLDRHCFDIDPQCSGRATCDCMGNAICGEDNCFTDPTDIVGNPDFECSCPTC